MKNKTDITIILDRSGSMETIKSATIESINSFLTAQKAAEMETSITLIQFDDQYEVLYEDQNIHQAKYLNQETYQPRGMTALLDAMGTTIKLTNKKLKNAKVKPDHVLLVIITDGEENASNKFKRSEIFQMIRKREQKNNWKFIFLAANQDAIVEGQKYGIKAHQSLTFSHDKNGIIDAVNSLSEKCFFSISKNEFNDICFNDEDRKKQER